MQKRFLWLILLFQWSFVFIQKGPISGRYPISDGALFSNYFDTNGHFRLFCYSLGIICVIFHVIDHFLRISLVMDKFRLFVRTLKIAKFQYFQKITKFQLKTYAIILFAPLLEYKKMLELIGPWKKLFCCSNMPQGYIVHLNTLFRTSEIGSSGWKKVRKPSIEPQK